MLFSADAMLPLAAFAAPPHLHVCRETLTGLLILIAMMVNVQCT